MLREVTPGVLVRQSAFCRSNAVVVLGEAGALLIDPGVTGDDLTELAGDLRTHGITVAAGLTTHPHWDHMLWHAAFGSPPRWATRACVEHAAARLDDARTEAARLAPGAPLDLVGRLTPLPDDAETVPWDGPRVRVVEHRAHAPGHAALLVEDAAVLVAGDMLSDVEIPLLDLEASDPIDTYAEGLTRLERLATGASTVIPGHGAVGDAAELSRRLDLDRAYLSALESAGGDDDPRLADDAPYGHDWLLRDHRVHVAHLRRE